MLDPSALSLTTLPDLSNLGLTALPDTPNPSTWVSNHARSVPGSGTKHCCQTQGVWTWHGCQAKVAWVWYFLGLAWHGSIMENFKKLFEILIFHMKILRNNPCEYKLRLFQNVFFISYWKNTIFFLVNIEYIYIWASNLILKI